MTAISSQKNWHNSLFQFSLILLILIGLFFRFAWVNWSQGANLHPDEYGLTNTLTQLSIPKTVGDYFNTRESPLSPYAQYDEAGQLIANGPDNGMRWGQWPVIIIRFVAELGGNTGYDELRLTGRSLSALADGLTVLLIFLIGARLYSRAVGVLAAALSSLAVLQIQQSHFMTVDNFAVAFAMLALYACVRVAQRPCALRQDKEAGLYLPDPGALTWYLIFGVSLGMALASKINLLPLAGMILVAGWISVADLHLHYRKDLWRIFLIWSCFTILAILAAGLTFRLTQPMSFRQPVGDTTLFTFHLNPDWLENMRRAQAESNGIGGGPPGEQWAHRTVILFPWINMVVWGLGLPLGLMSWGSFLWVAWKLLRHGERWRAHLIPLVWTGGYFLFMATRWVKSIRYFLPIYPFMALFAAWAVSELWRWAKGNRNSASSVSTRPLIPMNVRGVLSISVTSIVILGTLVWVFSFVQTVYLTDHTRVQATRWIFEQIPGPFHLAIQGNDDQLHFEPVAAPDKLQVSAGQPFVQSFVPMESGRLTEIILPHASIANGAGHLNIRIATDLDGKNVLDEAIVDIYSAEWSGSERRGEFQQADLKQGTTYYLIATTDSDTPIVLQRTVIANESWDEGLPFPFDGRDPFGQLYKGITMEVRWYDDENKRQMFIDTLSEADYVILPSQRAIWTTCRIPRTYPMTMEYYRALFDGRLGFDLVAFFSAPLKLGPLEISDVGGTLAWNNIPALPLFNHSQLAAEEAFSVYDHPPVWIFRKRIDYDQKAVETFFEAIDLSQVVVQSPRDASLPPCP
jgi:Dolichyl-phosphate-mannose-protein mannosyltransferase